MKNGIKKEFYFEKKRSVNLMKKNKLIKKIFFSALGIFSLILLSCDTWLSGKNFFDTVADEVKYANAPQISVFVRYPDRSMGETSPNGSVTQKADIPFTVTAVDSNQYGFYKWMAFSTKDFKTIRQYSSMTIVESEEKFLSDETYAGKVLPETEVKFEDPYNAVTTVTVINERNDVFIMPICVKRPTVVSSLPKHGASNVVKNTGLTIVFSNGMNPESLILDGKINPDRVDISRRTGSAESYKYTDISSKFGAATLSTTGKTFSIQLADMNSDPLERGTTVVTIARDVEDAMGYTMADDVEIQFVVGDNTDTEPPVTDDIKVGYKTLEDTTDSETNSTVWKKNRIAKTGNIWALIQDKTASTDSESTEANVYQLYYNLDRVKNNSGVSDSANISTKAYIGYTSGECEFDPSVSNAENNGTGFSLDLSDKADGLYRIRIWGSDQAGMDCGGTDSRYHKDAYFVKDTMAPDVSNADKISTNSADAKYGWYSNETLNSMQVTGSTGIVDSPAATDYRSDKVFWKFQASDDVSSLNVFDSSWSEVSTTAITLKSLGINFTGKDAAADGSLPLYVVFRDDVGNMTNAIPVGNLKYDEVKPVIGDMSWTDASGNAILPLTNQSLLSTQVLNIPITEELSGTKILGLTVKNETTSAAVSNPMAATDFAISYVAAGDSTETVLTKGTDYKFEDSNTIILTTPLKTGTLKIKNLTVASGDVSSEISVFVKDTALNKSDSKTARISCDTVAPKITKVEVCNNADEIKLIERTLYENNNISYWLTSDCLPSSGSKSATKVPLKLTITETGTGVATIKFTGGTTTTSSSTEIYLGTTKLTSGTDFTCSGDTITFLNGTNPKVKGTNVVLYVLNLTMSKVQSSDGNEVSIEIADFAAGKDATWKGFYYGNTKKASEKIYIDGYNPGLNKVYPMDSGRKADGTTEVLGAEEGYTNSQDIDVIAILKPERSDSSTSELVSSGNQTLKFTSDVSFSASSKVYVVPTKFSGSTVAFDGTTAQFATATPMAATGYEIDVSKGTLKFKKAFLQSYAIKITDVHLNSATNGSQDVAMTTSDATGFTSAALTASIILDTKKPWMTGAESDDKAGYGPHVGSKHIGKTNVWPRRPASDRSYGVSANDLPDAPKTTNTDGTTIRYFYSNYSESSGYGMDLGISANDNIRLRNVDKGTVSYVLAGDKSAEDVIATGENSVKDYNDGQIKSAYSKSWSDEKWFAVTSASNTYSVVIADAAGNYSPSYTVVVVKENTGPSGKMGTGTTAADFFPFVYSDPTGSANGEQWQVLSIPYPTTKGGCTYRNVVAYHGGSITAGNRAQISVDLTGYSGLNLTASSVPVEYYAIYDLDTTPSENGTNVIEWMRWLPVTKMVDNTITVFPYLGGDVGQMHLWLKDVCGNITKVPILTQEHAVMKATTTPDLVETWERDGDLAITTDGGSTDLGTLSFTGLGLSRYSEDGYVKTPGTINYYNEKPYFLMLGGDDHCRMGAVAVVKDKAYKETVTLDKTPDANCFYRERAAALDTLDPEHKIYTRRAKLILRKTERTSGEITKALVDKDYADDSTNYTNGLCSKWNYGIGVYEDYDAPRWMRVNYPAYYAKNDLGKTDAEIAAISREYPYMYLCVEDGVGNFGIWSMSGTVSDYSAKRWYYDNEAPRVSLRTDSTIYGQGSGATATGNLGTTAATNENVQKFMPNNAGKRVCVDDSGRIRFSALTDGVNGNTTCGTNMYTPTKDMLEKDIGKKAYFDLSVEDDSALSAYKYTTSSATPTSWNENLKVCRDIPTDIFSTNVEEPKDVYLHVKDLVGNITSVKLSSSKWIPDFNWPGPSFTSSETEKTLSRFKEFSLTLPKNTSRPYNSENLKFTVPGSGKVTLKLSDIKSWFDDVYLRVCTDGVWNQTGTSSYPNQMYGLSKTEKDVRTASDELELDFSSSTSIKVYLYDAVGNFFTLTATGSKDSTAPSVTINDINLNTGASSDDNSVRYYSSGTVSVSTYTDDKAGIYGWYIDENATGSTDSADYATTSAPFALPAVVTSDPYHYLYLHVIDNMGNVANVKLKRSGVYDKWKYDNEKPNAPTIAVDSSSSSIACATDSGIKYDRTATSVTLKPTSTSTDVKGYNTDGTTSCSSTVSVNTTGANKTVNVYAVDYAGNVSDATPVTLVAADAKAFEYTIGGTPIKHITDGSVNFYKSNNISVNLTWTGFSELQSWKICTSSDGTGAIATGTASTATLTLPTTLTTASNLYIYATSKAGSIYKQLTDGGIGKWCYDNTKPAAPTITIPSTYMSSNYYTFTDNKLVCDKSKYSNVYFAPSSTDTNGIAGYNIDGNASINSYIKNNGFMYLSGSTTAQTVKFYAVDNAGNVSEPTEVTYVLGNARSYSPTITGTYKTVNGCNYFNSPVTVDLGWSGFATVKYWQVGTSTSKTSVNCTSTTDGATPLGLPQLTSASTLYIYFEDSLNGKNYTALTADGVSKWCYDATNPSSFSISSVEATVGGISSSSYANTSSSTIYYREDATSVDIKVSATDANLWCVNTTGEVDASSNVTSSLFNNYTGTITINSPTAGQITLYAVDKAGNKASRTVTLKAVKTPTLTCTTVSEAENYYKSSNAPSFTITIGANGNDTSIKYNYGYTIGGTSTTIGTSSAAGDYIVTLPDTEYDLAAVTLWTEVSGYGNRAEDPMNKWCCDNTKPTAPTLTAATAQGTSAATSTASANFVINSSSKLLYRADAPTLNLTLSSTDSNLWCINQTGTKDATSNVSGSSANITITASGSATETKTLYAVDKAGNVSDKFELTLVDLHTPVASSSGFEALTAPYYYKSAESFTVTVTSDGNSENTYKIGYRVGGADTTIENGVAAGDYTFTLPTNTTAETTYILWVENKVGIGKVIASKACVYDGTVPSLGYTVDSSVLSDNYKIRGNTIYYKTGESITVTITASDANLVEIYRVDSAGTKQTISSGSTVSTGDTKKVVAVDKAGNESSVTFTPSDNPSAIQGNFLSPRGIAIGSVNEVKPKGLLNLVNYYTARESFVENDLNEEASNFKYGEIVESKKSTVAKKSSASVVTPIQQNGLINDDAVVEAVDSQISTDHAWTPENSADLESPLAINQVSNSVENSAQIISATDYSTDNKSVESENRPWILVLALGFAAIFGVLTIILQKKRR